MMRGHVYTPSSLRSASSASSQAENTALTFEGVEMRVRPGSIKFMQHQPVISSVSDSPAAPVSNKIAAWILYKISLEGVRVLGG